MAAQALLLRPTMHWASVAIPSSLNLHIPTRYSAFSPQSQPGLFPGPITFFTHLSQQRILQFHIYGVQGAILGVEPDLPEDYIEDSEYKTAGEDTEIDFPYGKADGAHTWHKGDDNEEFIDAMSNVIKEAGGPNDNLGQATISWLFLPVVFSGLAIGVQPEYLFFAAALFIFAFIGIEMTKPDKPSNFEYDPNFPGDGYKP